MLCDDLSDARYMRRWVFVRVGCAGSLVVTFSVRVLAVCICSVSPVGFILRWVEM